jgi:hypothetical protein
VASLYNLGMDFIENTTSKNSSIVACLFVAVETWLLNYYPAMDSV